MRADIHSEKMLGCTPVHGALKKGGLVHRDRPQGRALIDQLFVEIAGGPIEREMVVL